MMSLLGMYITYQIVEGIVKGIIIGAVVPCEEQITMPKIGETYKGSIRK